MNLLVETIKYIKEVGISGPEIAWVGNEHFYFTWDEFKKISNVEYCAGFGAQEVAQDLIIVGADFWLARHEYDGSERWEFMSRIAPKKPSLHALPLGLIVSQKEVNAMTGWFDMEPAKRKQ